MCVLSCVPLSFCQLIVLVLSVLFFFLMIRRPPRSTLFPYRRSSDLIGRTSTCPPLLGHRGPSTRPLVLGRRDGEHDARHRDRKSTRLNSSHSQISYAVFCLKKKKERTKHGVTV